MGFESVFFNCVSYRLSSSMPRPLTRQPVRPQLQRCCTQMPKLSLHERSPNLLMSPRILNPPLSEVQAFLDILGAVSSPENVISGCQSQSSTHTSPFNGRNYLNFYYEKLLVLYHSRKTTFVKSFPHYHFYCTPWLKFVCL